jgi:hypothetical protein
MSILMTLMCKAGRHSGEWSHPGSRCVVTRLCDACGKHEEQTHHAWGSFDDRAVGQCDQTRRCERCGSTESRSCHEWGPWLYLNSEFASPQVHTCRRCRQTERTRPTLR